jgi:NAD(P)-dependent dehydrogenase (short-subunit alcohol dehydrogenase family)
MTPSTPAIRRVFLTGAGRGIGHAIKTVYAARGWEVVAPSRDELDLASPSAVTAFLDSLEFNFDVLINNAAENKIGPIADLSAADWARTVAVNLTAPLLLMQKAARYMCTQQWGRIVNISSCFSLVSRAGRAPYATSKSGLNGLTRTAALEYAPHHVLVNAVCPGFVATDLTRQNNSDEQIAELCTRIPLGRLAEPAEIAEYVYFLGSDMNTYITGQTAVIDGGFLCQ